ncbi:MAG TPA: iron-containing alcohol dehydrogenase [Anaeromyxobacteraceae bacterium]|nr:iron-containing alcohol dehydrogenase [Anaeromyxobacteraceae bacterium]
MVNFEFATAARILFGAGRAGQAPAEIVALGVHRVLFVTGRGQERSAPLKEGLQARGVEAVGFRVEQEPTVELVREGVARGRQAACDGVVAVGGGSVLDGGKAIAALLANPGDPLDYLEVLGRGKPLQRASSPFVAVPTTAGTGAEVTKNAVLGVGEARAKASLRSPLMLARIAIVDPDYLKDAPPRVLSGSGLDALSQLIEPYLSARANPVTDAFAFEGIRRSARSLRKACLEGTDPALREDLALASVLGGLCLANAGLGAVHGFAAPLGGMFEAPHGALCAALLPAVLGVNLRALRSRSPEHPAVGRYHELARWLCGREQATSEEGIAWVEDLCRALRVPGLGSYGMRDADIPALVSRAKVASSMKSNPVALQDEELAEIAERSL